MAVRTRGGDVLRRQARSCASKPAPTWQERASRGRQRRGGDFFEKDVKRWRPQLATTTGPGLEGITSSAKDAEEVVSVERGRPQALERRGWVPEIALASPAGKMLKNELGHVLRTSVYISAMQHVETRGTTFFAGCVIPMAYFPKLSYAYRRAGVEPQSPNLTVLVWCFPSTRGALYAVASTSRKGALDIVKKRHAGGVHLSNINVVVGQGTGKHYVWSTGDPDAAEEEDEDQYLFINRDRVLMVGPGESALPNFLASEEFSEPGSLGPALRTPSASYSQERFDWGNHDADGYFVPVRGDGDTDTSKALPGADTIGMYGGDTLHPHAAFDLRPSDENAEERDARHFRELAGRASRLQYFDPERAVKAYAAEEMARHERGKAMKQKMMEKVAQDRNLAQQRAQSAVTPTLSFDSI
eukprot:TRINITY_DN33372_c0_g1_i1.p1 TRINITY_DN33372_c0_g1~~TRINITY_DN33372_c0_g1_i1.p1  ORF type:complete len:436 (+),score=102.40 TRINITY_DN33372_c0_g1_i1:68-1309(+)